jgi:hypothetical protein
MFRDLTNTTNIANASKRRHAERALAEGSLSPVPVRLHIDESNTTRTKCDASRGGPTVGSYLSKVLDVGSSGRVRASDVVQVLEALHVLPRDSVSLHESSGVMDRAVIQMLLEQLFHSLAKRSTTRQHDNTEDERSSSSQRDEESTPNRSVSTVSTSSARYRRDAAVSVDTAAHVFNTALPASSIALAERLELAEQMSGCRSEKDDVAQQADQLSEVLQDAQENLDRYEVLIAQCQQALEARRVASNPLMVLVHSKLAQQEAAESVLHEKHCAEAAAKVELQASEELVAVRGQEVDQWRARVGEWKQEIRTVLEDIETTKAEEEILLKRLESMRQRRVALEMQATSVTDAVASCQASLDSALEAWQDAVTIAVSASASHEAIKGDVDDAKAAIVAIERGIEVTREEFSLEKVEARSILQRYHLLCHERRRLRETLMHGTLELAGIKNTMASIVERSPRRVLPRLQRNEHLITMLIDELRVATEQGGVVSVHSHR